MTKRDKFIYWGSTIWLSLGMVSTGWVQLFKVKGDGPGSIESMIHLGYPDYLLPLLGILKIIGVVVLLVPKFLLLKEWAYAGFFFLMAGALFSHLAAGDPMKELIPAVLLLLLTGLSWYYRPAERKIIPNR
jgi:uncharacterized membrane protein YphA (DoxX/SURF4 family)